MNKKHSNRSNPSSQGLPSQKSLSMGDMIIAAEADEACDHAWFAKHPRAIERRRFATDSELKLSGCQFGTIVRVRCSDTGEIYHVFPTREPLRS